MLAICVTIRCVLIQPTLAWNLNGWTTIDSSVHVICLQCMWELSRRKKHCAQDVRGNWECVGAECCRRPNFQDKASQIFQCCVQTCFDCWPNFWNVTVIHFTITILNCTPSIAVFLLKSFFYFITFLPIFFTVSQRKSQKVNFSNAMVTIMIEDIGRDRVTIMSRFRTLITHKKEKESWANIAANVNACGVANCMVEDKKVEGRTWSGTKVTRHTESKVGSINYLIHSLKIKLKLQRPCLFWMPFFRLAIIKYGLPCGVVCV